MTWNSVLGMYMKSCHTDFESLCDLVSWLFLATKSIADTLLVGAAGGVLLFVEPGRGSSEDLESRLCLFRRR